MNDSIFKKWPIKKVSFTDSAKLLINYEKEHGYENKHGKNCSIDKRVY
jgi:hypothetical protein